MKIKEGGYYQMPSGLVRKVNIIFRTCYGPHVKYSIYDKDGTMIGQKDCSLLRFTATAIRRVKPKKE